MTLVGRGGKLIVLAGFAVVSLAVLAFLFSLAGGRVRLGEAPYTVKALVPDAQRLVASSDVRDQGVKVGRVTDVDNRGTRGLVTFELDDGHAPLYRNATVQVRTKTLVGENYLEIERGSPRAGAVPRGSVLPIGQADVAVRLDEILSALDRRTRRNVRRNLRSLSAGLVGRGQNLNDLLGAARPTMDDGGKVMRVLRSQREELAALVDDTGQVMQAFADRTEQLRTLISQAQVTAEAVAARDEQLRQTLRELPATLDQVRHSALKFGGFAGRATPVVRDLRLAAADLTPVVRDLRPTARDARRLFAELPPLLRVTDPALVELRRFARRVPALSVSLDAVLRQLNPALAYLRPYDHDMRVLFHNFNYENGAILPTGPGNATISVSEGAAAALWTPEMRRTYDALVEVGALTPIHNLRSNHYPKPNQLGNEQPFDGHYPRVEAAPPTER